MYPSRFNSHHEKQRGGNEHCRERQPRRQRGGQHTPIGKKAETADEVGQVSGVYSVNPHHYHHHYHHHFPNSSDFAPPANM